ncbi:hypothetical protein CHS0354_014019, partial [Potamilus streckersoni]
HIFIVVAVKGMNLWIIAEREEVSMLIQICADVVGVNFMHMWCELVRRRMVSHFDVAATSRKYPQSVIFSMSFFEEILFGDRAKSSYEEGLLAMVCLYSDKEDSSAYHLLDEYEH